jgi:MarR family 2-MHQ and catechol resistance regulon transcriptional repressor
VTHIPLHEMHYLATYWMMAKLSLAHLNKLTPQQFVVLGLVATQGLKTFKELRQVLVLPMSSFTFLVDKLEKRKLVKRERAANDRRQWLLRATSNGRRLVSEMMEKEPDILKSILVLASPDEKAKLTETLSRLPFLQPGELPDKPILEK